MRRFISFLQRLLRENEEPAPQPAQEAQPSTTNAGRLAAYLATIGPAAAAGEAPHSPGLGEPLARARAHIHALLEEPIARSRAGLARSLAADLATSAAVEEFEEATRRSDEARGARANHKASEPAETHVVTRIAAGRWIPILIASLCTAFELVVTAPALTIVTHGAELFGVGLDYVLAGLFGLLIFAAAEVAASLFLTWRASRYEGSVPRWRLFGRAGRASIHRFDGLLAGAGCALLIVAVIGSLGWLMQTRSANERATQELRSDGKSSLSGIRLVGVPGSVQQTRPTAGGSGQASGPIAGLGAIGGPALTGRSPTTPSAGAEGDFGPVGAGSMIAFLVALIAAVLAGAAPERRAWLQTGEDLKREERERRAELTAVRRAGHSAIIAVPTANLPLDAPAAEAHRIVGQGLETVGLEHEQIQLLYLVYCKRIGTPPVTLTFPAIPDVDEEAQRLFGPGLPGVTQVGQRYGGPAPDPGDAPTEETDHNEAPAADAQPPRPRNRPDTEEVRRRAKSSIGSIRGRPNRRRSALRPRVPRRFRRDRNADKGRSRT